ncbi:MAG TPA: TonB-dependent receptor, partial [Anaerolineales bacterium]|nr:TonB-dependent receptor [Anaerolineales bacterium]
NEIYKFQNGFAPAYYGLYQFPTLDAFYQSAAGVPGQVTRYELRWAANAEGTFPLVETKATQLGFYAQDKYEFSKKFNVTLGLRVDIPIITSDIARNPDAESKTFRDGQTILTDQLQKTQVLWSPRVGFNWDLTGENKTQIRGGTGVFAGRVPYVWISNQASNNGVLFGSKVFNGAELAAITFSGDVNEYRPVGDAAVASASYNLAVTDDNFKFPQVWRTNIAVDHDFGQMLIASLDIAYTKDMNAVYHQNVNLPNATEFATGPDNRPIFYKTFPNTGSSGSKGYQINTNISDAIVMTNTNKGYSYFITAQLKKSFLFGLDAFAAYTYTDSRSVNDGGSIAQSIWRDRQISGDPNANVQSYFTNLAKHRIIVSANYRKEYMGFMGTSVGMFWEMAPNGRFSYV